jgi:hypothetical protein
MSERPWKGYITVPDQVRKRFFAPESIACWK